MTDGIYKIVAGQNAATDFEDIDGAVCDNDCVTVPEEAYQTFYAEPLPTDKRLVEINVDAAKILPFIARLQDTGYKPTAKEAQSGLGNLGVYGLEQNFSANPTNLWNVTLPKEWLAWYASIVTPDLAYPSYVAATDAAKSDYLAETHYAQALVNGTSLYALQLDFTDGGYENLTEAEVAILGRINESITKMTFKDRSTMEAATSPAFANFYYNYALGYEEFKATQQKITELTAVDQSIKFTPTDTTQISVADFNKWADQTNFKQTVGEKTYNCILAELGKDGQISVTELGAYLAWFDEHTPPLTTGALDRVEEGAVWAWNHLPPVQKAGAELVLSMLACAPVSHPEEYTGPNYAMTNFGDDKSKYQPASAAIKGLIEYIKKQRYQSTFHVVDIATLSDAEYTAVVMPGTNTAYELRNKQGQFVDNNNPNDVALMNKVRGEYEWFAREQVIVTNYGPVGMEQFLPISGGAPIKFYLDIYQKEWAEKNAALYAGLSALDWTSDIDVVDEFVKQNESAQGVVEGFKAWKHTITQVVSFKVKGSDKKVYVTDLDAAARGEYVVASGAGNVLIGDEKTGLENVAQYLLAKQAREEAAK